MLTGRLGAAEGSVRVCCLWLSFQRVIRGMKWFVTDEVRGREGGLIWLLRRGVSEEGLDWGGRRVVLGRGGVERVRVWCVDG